MSSKIEKVLFALHPVLFGIFPILFLFAHNIDQMYFTDTLIPLGIVLGFILVLLFVLTLLLRNKEKAGVITTVILILFFSYGHFWEIFDGLKIVGFVMGKHGYLLSFWGFLIIAIVFFIIRTRNNLLKFTSILNIIACSLILISLFNIGIYMFKTIGSGERISLSEKATEADMQILKNLPDIYYIILDGYASNRTLKEVYNFNNNSFTDYLKEKGFFVASKSCSNYSISSLSLASSLNMEYINYLADEIGLESRNVKVPYQMIRNSRVMNFLKSKGYKFIHFGSGWGATKSNEYADRDIDCGKIDEFQILLIKTTMLVPFIKNLSFLDLLRKRILNTFTEIPKTAKNEELTFTFAHLVTPHPPYLFERNGLPVKKAELKFNGYPWIDREHYVNQLVFVNKRIKDIVNKILSSSKNPPIIILQADHGTASLFAQACKDNWQYPTDSILMKSMNYLMKGVTIQDTRILIDLLMYPR
jgi:hypothetical protein